jgi:hypothetical protein
MNFQSPKVADFKIEADFLAAKNASQKKIGSPILSDPINDLF